MTHIIGDSHSHGPQEPQREHSSSAIGIHTVRALPARIAARYARIAHVTLREAALAVGEVTGERVNKEAVARAWHAAYPDIDPRRSRGARAVSWLADQPSSSVDDAAMRYGLSAREVGRQQRLATSGLPRGTSDRAARRAIAIGVLSSGGTTSSAAEASGLAHDTVRRWAARAGITATTKSQELRAGRAAAVLAAIDRGLTIQEAATECGTGRSTVHRILVAAGRKIPRGQSYVRDGRIARAVALVVGGMSIAAACAIEKCAFPSVSSELRRLSLSYPRGSRK